MLEVKKPRWTLTALLIPTVMAVPLARAQARAAGLEDQLVLPRPEPAFKGKIGRTLEESKASFPDAVTAPKGAPNVIVILTDDVGFSATSTFGGPVDTPAFTQLAERGLRYNRFNTTGICSPTRAALLTGRNHHSAGTGFFPNIASGFPGYTGHIPKRAGAVPEVLRQNGYSTAMFGKNHNTPFDELGPTGPFDNWPTGLGFEYFYGFNAHGVNLWAPPIYQNTTPVEPPTGDPEYHLDKDLADHAIGWIRTHEAQVPDKPFFLYFATGSSHAPHHAPKDWIARYRGQFDQGWDKLREESFVRQKAQGIIPADAKQTPRPAGIPAWSSLTAQQKRIYARMMEVYAANLAFADHQIGRVLQAVADLGDQDNTLVIYIQGDNGGSAEGTLGGNLNEEVALHHAAPESFDYLESMMDEMGGPFTYQHYPAGWAWATSGPFPWMKQMASHFGATRNGTVISWPARIRPDGQMRSQFHHLVDIAPTIYEAAGIRSPDVLNGVPQKPLEGVSMNYTFAAALAPGRKRTQYFELMGNRGIYHDGWFANTTPRRVPWETGSRPPGNAAEDYQWELYKLDSDFSQANDIARANPKKLAEMKQIFWREAEKYDVLPIEDSFTDRAMRTPAAPGPQDGRTQFRYTMPMTRIPQAVAPPIERSDFEIVAKVSLAKGQVANGVLATLGGRFGGWVFRVDNGRPSLTHALSQQAQYHYTVMADRSLPMGESEVQFVIDYDGDRGGTPASASILINGKPAGSGRIANTLSRGKGSGQETFDVGSDTGTPVTGDYPMPGRFNGTFGWLEVRLTPRK